MSLMLINPRKRGTKKRRSAAQKAATARMLAARRGGSTHKRRTRRSSARRSNPIGLSRVTRHVRRRRHARRHNPISMKAGNIGELVFNGLKGAVGSVAINAAVSFLPAVVRTGKVLYVTRAAAAIVLGVVGGKIPGLGKHARVAAEGALAVNFADLINSLAAGKLPGTQLHGVGGEYMGEVEQEQMAAYLNGTHMSQQLPYATGESYGHGMNGVGEYTPMNGVGEYVPAYQ